MELCNFCLEGKTEICKYFVEHFLEAEGPVEYCMAFKPDPEAEKDELEGIIDACQ